MLISCPSCPKIYRVPASAIPPEGREVSCSACGTVWYEQGIEAEVVNVGGGGGFRPVEMRGTARSTRRNWAPHAEVSRPNPFREAEPEERQAQTALAIVPPVDEPADEPIVEPVDAKVTPLPDMPVRAAFNRARDEAPKAPSAQTPPDGAPAAEAPASETAKAAEEVASFFNSEKWEARALSLRSIGQWFARRRERPSEDINAGASAALKFRQRARARDRNRLTPMRCLGWSVWTAAAAAVIVTVIDRDAMGAIWPRTENLYTAVMGAEVEPQPLRLEGVTTRFAQSVEGPVLEIRGKVINDSDIAAHPVIDLIVDGQRLPGHAGIELSDAEVPTRGERPFVIRAMMPEGARRADVRLAAGERISVASSGFTFQQQGSGWGGSTLPPLPVEALRSAQTSQ